MPKKTFKTIKETENEGIIQVKENQRNLLENCRQIEQNQSTIDEFCLKEKGHGRKEERKVEVFSSFNAGVSLDEEWRQYIEAVVKVIRRRKKFCTKTKEYKMSYEVSFYLSTITMTAEIFFHAIRRHWHIENKNHYVRDVTMAEDLSRIRKNPQNMAKLRSFALNIIRKNGTENISTELFTNCCNLSKMVDKYQFVL